MSTVEHIASVLAAEHSFEDRVLRKVFWAPDPHEVRLVEVTPSVPERREYVSLRAVADPPVIPYKSWVLVLNPADWERVQSGEMRLPEAFRDLRRIL